VPFFGFHWSLTTMEPSGKSWPLPGTPALYALIIVGLATITWSTSSARAEETSAQSSYPRKSENEIPLGDFSEYLSCAKTAAAIAIVRLLLRFMADFLSRISILALGPGTAQHTPNSSSPESQCFLRESSLAPVKRQIPPTGKCARKPDGRASHTSFALFGSAASVMLGFFMTSRSDLRYRHLTLIY
jgi:hypothetical protein